MKKKTPDRTQFWHHSFRLPSNGLCGQRKPLSLRFYPSPPSTHLSLSAFSEPLVNAACCQKQAIHSHDCRQTGRSKCQAGTGYLLCESSEEARGWLILNETERANKCDAAEWPQLECDEMYFERATKQKNRSF